MICLIIHAPATLFLHYFLIGKTVEFVLFRANLVIDPGLISITFYPLMDGSILSMGGTPRAAIAPAWFRNAHRIASSQLHQFFISEKMLTTQSMSLAFAIFLYWKFLSSRGFPAIELPFSNQ